MRIGIKINEIKGLLYSNNYGFQSKIVSDIIKRNSSIFIEKETNKNNIIKYTTISMKNFSNKILDLDFENVKKINYSDIINKTIISFQKPYVKSRQFQHNFENFFIYGNFIVNDKNQIIESVPKFFNKNNNKIYQFILMTSSLNELILIDEKNNQETILFNIEEIIEDIKILEEKAIFIKNEIKKNNNNENTYDKF